LKIVKIIVEIIAIEAQRIECLLSDEKENIQLVYVSDEERILTTTLSPLVAVIHKNEFQFMKVMRSAIKGDCVVGQTIHCVFIEGFNFLKESDFCNYIRVDRRKGKLEITTNDTEMKDIHKIYADGSYASEIKQSGFGGFIEAPDGTQQIFHKSFNNGSSNLMELLAVMEGLQLLESVEKIQVNTDSRFVIRGLVQWVHFWMHNGWQTANGSEVKFVKYWQQIEQLCHGKVIEFKWIKGHSGNEKQDFCHQLAIECANRTD
jgi:ribonuclease HI